MNYQQVLDYLKDNCNSLEKEFPNSTLVVAPFLHMDLDKFVKAVKENGVSKVDARDFSSDKQFSFQAFKNLV